MAGHSKWANIKHRKNLQDERKSKIFQKISKEIIAAIEIGNSNDPSKNARLRLAVEKAKANNIPNDNISKILNQKNKDKSDFIEITYEGYGPYGTAFLIECLTNNLNRTAPQIKSIFSKYNGKMGTTGSVKYLFETKGIFILDKNKYNFSELFNLVIEMDILDIQEEEDVIIIETKPENFFTIKNSLSENNINLFISYEITKIAKETVDLFDEQIDKINKIILDFENLEDVQSVYVNI